jgi:hypothetical protein
MVSFLPRRLRFWRFGAVDFHHRDTRLLEVPCQASPVGAGALDADHLDLAEGLEPTPELAVALRGRLELGRGQQRAPGVESGGDVEVAVGVDPARDDGVVFCHRGHCHSSQLPDSGGTTPAGTADKTVMSGVASSP